MKEKILYPADCQNPVTRITKAKEILKNLLPAGSWRPLKCIFSGKGKSRSQRAAKPRSGVILAKGKKTAHSGPQVLSVLCTGKPERGKSAAVTEQVSTTVPKSAILRVLPLAGNLLGSAFPKPCYGGLRRKNISVRQAAFLREPPRKYLTDQPIFCDK